MREIALHQPGEQHVTQGDGGTAGSRSHKQGRKVAGTWHQPAGVRGPQQQPRCEHGHGAEQDAFGAKPSGQDGGQRREDTQERDGHGGEYNNGPARQAGVGRHLGKNRGETGEYRAEVQPDEHQAEAQVSQGPAAGLRALRAAA